jgi:nitroimidazol reductase NimA-like FMN-containing flavoprotein (pyridoxamine 5'-phosphate oxidase superfamily)
VTTPAELTRDECLHLLSGESVGRVALCTPIGPRIVPLNYAVHDESVVFRTTPYSELGSYGPNTELAFEVDRIDGELRQGWSVVVLGRGQVVEDPDEVADIRSTWGPRPWAGGSRNLFMRVPCREVTGRRVGDDWSTESMTPYGRVLGADG